MRLNEKVIVRYGFSKPSDREGWLFKRGEINRSLQKRYCVLKGNLLFYHEKRPDSSSGTSSPLGVIFLEGCRIEVDDCELPSGCFGFKIAFNQGRTYNFAAATHDDLESWVKYLTQSSYQCLRLTFLELQRQLKELKSTSDASDGSTEESFNKNHSIIPSHLVGKTFAEIHHIYGIQFQDYFQNQKKRRNNTSHKINNDTQSQSIPPSKELLDLFGSL